jgi:uncharacterized RDD family membrane protein YckC
MDNSKSTSADKEQKSEEVELNVSYAGLKERLLAYLIDIAIVLTPFVLLSEFSDDPDNSLLKNWPVIIVIFGLYNALAESSDSQATPGKRIFKLKVMTDTGGKLTFRKAYYRYGASLLSILPFGLGIWSMINDKRKQTWHDQILSCYVIVDKKLNQEGD